MFNRKSGWPLCIQWFHLGPELLDLHAEFLGFHIGDGSGKSFHLAMLDHAI
jgi:hypothetical protein